MALVTVIPGTFTTPGLPTLGIKGFADTFTRPDATVLGSTEGMPTRPWENWSSTGSVLQGITGNAGYICSSSGAGHGLAGVDAATGDGTLEVTQGASATNAQNGPAFRITSITDYWRVVNAQGVEYRLQKFVGGTVTTVSAASGVTPAPGDVIRVVLNGSSITVFINGTQRMQTTDAHNATATRHGFYNNVTGSTIRDIKFTAA